MNVSYPSSIGIWPVSWFAERSSDSRTFNWPNDFGMLSLRALWDKLRWKSILRSPTASGIFHENYFGINQ